jgi:hypothetical protein
MKKSKFTEEQIIEVSPLGFAPVETTGRANAIDLLRGKLEPSPLKLGKFFDRRIEIAGGAALQNRSFFA